MGDLLHLVSPDRVDLPACGDVVDHVAVRPGDNGGVVGGFRPSLDFDAVHADTHEVVQMVDHAHVPGVHDIGSLLILKDGEVFAGPLFFHQIILIAAGLCAGTAVGIPACHIVGKQTAAGIGHAHSPVGEDLQFQALRRFRPDRGDLLQGELPGQHHAFGSQLMPGRGGGVICHADLGGDVELAMWGVLLGQPEGAQVRHDQRVHAAGVQQFQMGGQPLQLAAPGHGVHGHVGSDAEIVGQPDGDRQLLRGKIPREGAHAEARSGQIDRIGPVTDRHIQLFHIPCRGEQFRFFHAVFSRFCYCPATMD